MQLLSPFDPVLRDRSRALCRFGYYRLPLLDGDRLVGHFEPKLQRDEAALVIRGLWWEPAFEASKARGRLLQDALERLAKQVGAASISGARSASRRLERGARPLVRPQPARCSPGAVRSP